MKIIFSFFGLLLSLYSFCQYENIRPQGVYSSSFMIDEKPRTITYYMPASYGRQEAYPLLIVLHPEKSDAASIIKKYGDIIRAKADSAGCIVLYPEAYKGHWNNASSNDSINDVGFINIMAEFFIKQFDCDLSKMKLLGIGSGGDLCYKFNCESLYKPESVATINATVSDNRFSNCKGIQVTPKMNVVNTLAAKADIGQALYFLFSHREVK